MAEPNVSALDALRLSNTQSGSSNDKAPGQLGQSDFLELMTAQLKAQDPLNPGDTGEFLGQMAQFASVTGIQGLERSMQNLADTLQSSQALQASSMVGRTVLIPADKALLGAAGEVHGQVVPPPNATHLSIDVVNAAGETIDTLQLPVSGADTESFSWDGTSADGLNANPGIYEFRAHAQTLTGETSAQLQVSGRVESVLMGNKQGDLTLNIEGLGAYSAKDIVEIR